jgi:hypothetical protein
METVEEMIKRGKPCHDCGAKSGHYHSSGCDTERCPKCGGQLLSCDCFVEYDEDKDIEYFNEEEFNKYEREKWNGVMYYKEHLYCEEHNLYVYWGPNYNERDWVKCDKNHPGAQHDLNSACVKVQQNFKPKLKKK